MLLQLSFNITFDISNLFNTQNISNSIHVYQRKIASNHLIYGHIVNKNVMKTVFSFVTLDFLHFTYKILNNIDFVSCIHAKTEWSMYMKIINIAKIYVLIH